MTNTMLTRMMTGTALAVLLAATPALAQTAAPETEAPAASDTLPAPTDGEPGATQVPMDSQMESDDGATDGESFDATQDTPDAPSTGQAEGPADTGTLGDTAASAAEGLPTEPILTEIQPGQVTSRDVIGMDVRNFEDQSIGSINALVIDERNRVIAGIVSVGGFLGIGAKNVAVNWQEFTFDHDQNVAAVTLTRETLEDAPAFRDHDDLMAEAERDATQDDAPPAPMGQQPPPVD